MKYILKTNKFYFLGFDKAGIYPQWMTTPDEAKRYNTEEELKSEALNISWLTAYEIIKVDE